jgi:hypothetical protein
VAGSCWQVGCVLEVDFPATTNRTRYLFLSFDYLGVESFLCCGYTSVGMFVFSRSYAVTDAIKLPGSRVKAGGSNSYGTVASSGQRMNSRPRCGSTTRRFTEAFANDNAFLGTYRAALISVWLNSSPTKSSGSSIAFARP